MSKAKPKLDQKSEETMEELLHRLMAESNYVREQNYGIDGRPLRVPPKRPKKSK